MDSDGPPPPPPSTLELPPLPSPAPTPAADPADATESVPSPQAPAPASSDQETTQTPAESDQARTDGTLPAVGDDAAVAKVTELSTPSTSAVDHAEQIGEASTLSDPPGETSQPPVHPTTAPGVHLTPVNDVDLTFPDPQPATDELDATSSAAPATPLAPIEMQGPQIASEIERTFPPPVDGSRDVSVVAIAHGLVDAAILPAGVPEATAPLTVQVEAADPAPQSPVSEPAPLSPASHRLSKESIVVPVTLIVPPVSVATSATVRFARARWDYSAIEDNEISFKAGDRIAITDLCNEDWYEGKVGGKVGFFPANRVELLPATRTGPKPAAPPSKNLKKTRGNSSVATSPEASAANTVDAAEALLSRSFTATTDDDPFSDNKEDSEEAHDGILVVPLNDGDEKAASNVRVLATTAAWRTVHDEGGQIYYWNEETGQTSWSLPPRFASDSSQVMQELSLPLSGTATSPQPGNLPSLAHLDLSQLEFIPIDMIRKEGPLKKKKPAAVIDVINVGGEFTAEVAGKDMTSKKNAMLITESAGRQWLFVSEIDVAEWISALSRTTAESQATSFEDTIARILSRQKPEPDGQALKVPADPQSRSGRRSKRTSSSVNPGAGSGGESSRPSVAAAPTALGPQQVSESDKAKLQVRAKLGAFFAKRTKPKEKEPVAAAAGAERAGDLVFGGTLGAQLEREGRSVPAIVELCCAEVERRGLESQGIYRLSGNAATVTKLKTQFNNGESPQLDSEDMDINVVTGLLKSFFRDLQNPLIPFEYYDQFVGSASAYYHALFYFAVDLASPYVYLTFLYNAKLLYLTSSNAEMKSYDERLITLKTLVQSMPAPNYSVLEFLIRHLHRVSQYSEVNKMETPNLAIVFAPTLLRPANEATQAVYQSVANIPFHNTLVESLIQQCEWIFDGAED
ncbi:Rho GTPase-activating protein 27 [Cladochytrium tenue]|nr:Rho GTPase-activating protein 27 [Cladochytrium tenue]